MSASNARLIVFLLAAGFAVLLLGREVFLSSTQTIFWVGLCATSTAECASLGNVPSG
jgi:hypothetical protein